MDWSLSLRKAYIALIVDVMYHAIKDKRECCNSGYADDDHEKLCEKMGFRSGEEELRYFAESEWFERLFEELEYVKSDDVKEILIK